MSPCARWCGSAHCGRAFSSQRPGSYNLQASFIVTHLSCLQDWFWSELFIVFPYSHSVVVSVKHLQKLLLILVPVPSHPLPFLSAEPLCEPGEQSEERPELWAVPYVSSSHAEPEPCVCWQFSGHSFSCLWNRCLAGKWQYSCVLVRLFQQSSLPF